jgi:putative phosphoesterase
VTTRLGLISDPHSTPDALAQALAIFKQHQVDRIRCTGDMAGYFDGVDATIELLRVNNCECIIGNHDQSFLYNHDDDTANPSYQFLSQLKETLQLEIEGKRIYMVHAEPPSEQHGGIKLLDPDGDVMEERKTLWRKNLKAFNYDVLIVGHTHQVFAEQLDDVLVINPGSSAFNHSCMILTLPEMKTRVFALGDKEIVKCWNWSMFAQGQ